jgi:peptidoglycan hydrolase-like protein with peptidoglycan-binding domain
MIFSLTWLPSVLETAGLKVALVPGWESRGRAEMGRVLGVICHHTAGPRQGNMPSLQTLIDGRSDLPGPLSQLGLGRDGTFYVVAAGRCNHAGAGSWQGLTEGNTNFIGIEAENTGQPDDTPWPGVQLAAYSRGVAAILGHVGQPARFCAGHKEYALPKGRKDDPDFDMDAFRQDVAAIMAGIAPPAVLIPAAEPGPQPNNAAPRPTLRRGASGDLVKLIQGKCGVDADGVFGANTEAAVRAFQQARGAVPDGIVGPKTWALLDAA